MKKLILLLGLFIFTSTLSANNIQITNVSTVNQNVAQGYTYVNFTVTWDNSWRDAGNWDAAWIFVKYRVGGGTWQHAALGNLDADHIAPSGATINAPTSDYGKGVFIYRSTEGSGTNNFQNVQLKWRYNQNNLGPDFYVDIKVFGIEMVSIPSGSFYVGDLFTSDSTGQFCDGVTQNPYSISSENAVTLGGGQAGSIGNGNFDFDDFSNISSKSLPAAYPKGFRSFYCMKYELTQEQYADFLNTLTRTQQTNRISNAGLLYQPNPVNRYVMSGSSTPDLRNGIKCPIHIDTNRMSTPLPVNFFCDLNNNDIPNENGDGQNKACNLLSYNDGTAYADWAGLRPMSEFEFEKICRGPVYPVRAEFAWGSAEYAEVPTIINYGRNDEGPSGGNFPIYNQIPIRVGSCANSNSTRYSSGSSYWGVMDMTTNLLELVINVSNNEARNFTNTFGDGNIGIQHNVLTWPVSSGFGIRGGSVSDRAFTNQAFPPDTRFYERGIRLVRTL